MTQMKIEKHHTNRLEILHGGTISTMIDLGGYQLILTTTLGKSGRGIGTGELLRRGDNSRSLAVASKGLFSTGVSTDINISYISSGGKVGDTVTMEAECDRIGKQFREGN